jgi:hypothetical protein
MPSTLLAELAWGEQWRLRIGSSTGHCPRYHGNPLKHVRYVGFSGHLKPTYRPELIPVIANNVSSNAGSDKLR